MICIGTGTSNDRHLKINIKASWPSRAPAPPSRQWPEVMWCGLVVALLGLMANGQSSPGSQKPEDCVNKGVGYEHWHTVVSCNVPVTMGCCAAQCSQHRDCNYWTHDKEGHRTTLRNEQNGTCFLQSSTNSKKKVGPNLSSGGKSCLPPVPTRVGGTPCGSYTSYAVASGTLATSTDNCSKGFISR